MTTKTQLEQQLAAAHEALGQARVERDVALSQPQIEVRRDREAVALEACAEALDRLVPDRSAMTVSQRSVVASVTRVLRYLADRYGVEWPEPRQAAVLSVDEYEALLQVAGAARSWRMDPTGMGPTLGAALLALDAVQSR